MFRIFIVVMAIIACADVSFAQVTQLHDTRTEIVGGARTLVPQAVDDVLNRIKSNNRDIVLVDVMPRSVVEWEMMFDYTPTAQQLEMFNADRHDFSKKNSAIGLDSPKRLVELLERSRIDILLVGHNRDGALIFPNGEKINIDYIEKIALQRDVKIVQITCQGGKYSKNFPSVNYDIDIKSAYNLVSEIRSRRIGHPGEPFLSSSEKIIESFNVKNNIKRSRVRTGGVLAVSIAVYTMYEVYHDVNKAPQSKEELERSILYKRAEEESEW